MTPEISRIESFALIVDDIVGAEQFFEEAFDFVTLERRPADKDIPALLGVPDARIRVTIMAAGDQRVLLVAFDPPGRAYPGASTSTDNWFQHIAIIVSDMDAAYARLLAVGRFTPISAGGPVRLPAASGGVRAFKFRDADGHPLELLEFPEGKGPAAWEAKRGSGLFLGIDHSAMVVDHTARSVAFFESVFGLRRGAQSENVGVEQAYMDDVPGARATVTGMMPRTAPPHLELLDYHVGTRRGIAGATTSRDIVATHLVLETPDLATIVEALTRASARFISPGVVTLSDGTQAIMVLDPDGHRFVVRQTTEIRSGDAPSPS